MDDVIKAHRHAAALLGKAGKTRRRKREGEKRGIYAQATKSEPHTAIQGSTAKTRKFPCRLDCTVTTDWPYTASVIDEGNIKAAKSPPHQGFGNKHVDTGGRATTPPS